MEYKKEFGKWFLIKEKIEDNPRPPFEKLDVWWCYFGCNVGIEKDGKMSFFLRPVIVLDKINDKSLIAIPLTKTICIDDLHIPFYFNYDFSVADVAHIRSLDSKRLHEKSGRISHHVYNKIKKAIASRLVR
jgi:mRNA-degrading endonuclease toxin of MazEF toxin-antitoxin module